MNAYEKNIDNIVKNNLTGQHLKDFNRVYYGREEHCDIGLKESTAKTSENYNFQVEGYRIGATREQIREPKIVKIGLVQHSIVIPTSEPINDQREAIFRKVEVFLDTATSEGAQIVCLQETWSMPFFLCTKEKEKWSQFAEPAETGPTQKFISDMAKKYRMVIISPILEVDEDNVWWNTAVVVDENGKYLGKHRKNHLPSVGSFSETAYYAPGNTGHPVFQTKYGRIAVNICYGRHHALNWLMFAVNGAEIVFNPAATISQFGESFWGIEARNAAIANGYFTCSINRVGTEHFHTKQGTQVSRTYYGSSYISAPNGVRTPSLSREKDGLLLAEIDLNLCRQMKDQWGFSMTSRLPMYAEELEKVLKTESKTS